MHVILISGQPTALSVHLFGWPLVSKPILGGEKCMDENINECERQVVPAHAAALQMNKRPPDDDTNLD